MMYLKQILIIVQLLAICQMIKNDSSFGNPPFLPETNNDTRIEFGKHTSTSDYYIQFIYMDEMIQESVIIAYVNYTGDNQPSIGTFETDNTNKDLGAKLTQSDLGDTIYALNITEPQNCQKYTSYRFQIDGGEPESFEYKIDLTIRNTPRHQPIIVPNQNDCQIKEGPLINNGVTNCTYNVTDIDNFWDQLQFEISGVTSTSFDLIKNKRTISFGVLTLKVLKPLNYDEYTVHMLELRAWNPINNGTNMGKTIAIIHVLNIPMRPPKWKSIFYTKTFDEKTQQNYTVAAIDGDVQINTEINYKIINTEYDYFHVNKTTGDLFIEPINRDLVQIETFYFTLVAYKANNESSSCQQDIVIMINDVNDNYPEITIPAKVYHIYEETYWEFTKPFIVNDIDLAQNAQYNVTLNDGGGDKKVPVNWFQAFNIIPNEGYQKTEFKLNILNATKLDYEDLDWQNITLKLISEELFNKSHTRANDFEIRLINLNDELPIFDSNGVFTVDLKESIPIDSLVVTANAHDRDIGDSLIYSLSESSLRAFKINQTTGEIRTRLDKSLDHEVAHTVTLQVYAQDTFIDGIYNKTHKTAADVIINVIDVNDKTPTIKLNTKAISITENIPPGYKVNADISGYDPDTTANLQFLIEWNESWATKQGQMVNQSLFQNYLIIEWKNLTTNNDATATLIVNNPDKNHPQNTIDYENYDVLYLTVYVIDQNQEINANRTSAIIPIYIIDVNDNAPKFDTAITDKTKVIEDLAAINTLIGSVYATDADGPNYNYVTYSIQSLNGIPDDLVTIDKYIGDIYVNNDISCDEPNYWQNLNYTVIASDCENRDGDIITPCFNTKYNISINIMDVNNKKPFVQKWHYNDVAYIWEKSPTGTYINTVNGHDYDRDEPFRTVSYTLDYHGHPDLRKYFTINSTGSVLVDLTTDEILDRDHGPSNYTIFIELYDNENGTGQRQTNTTQFLLILNDINDHAPIYEYPDNFVLPAIYENSNVGKIISKIHAVDIDDPNLNNSKVQYGIDKAWNNDTNMDFTDYFQIETDTNNDWGLVKIKKSFQDNFGTYILNLTTVDLGVPAQHSNQKFTLVVSKYNYDSRDPVIVYPTGDLVLKTPETIDDVLRYYNNTILLPMKGDDGFNGKKWNLRFEITPDYLFEVIPDSRSNSEGTLKIKQLPTNMVYDCVLTVYDNGIPDVHSNTKSFKIYFMNNTYAPQFNETKWKTEFHENINGTMEQQILPNAYDPIGQIIGKQIHYFIIGGDTDNFYLESIENVVYLKVNKTNVLDYQKKHVYQLNVLATEEDYVPDYKPTKSILNIDIKVLGVNSHSPQFYGAPFQTGVTQHSQIGKILTLTATDVDVNDTIKYSMDKNSLTVSDPSLNYEKDNAFTVLQNGEIDLKIEIQPNMKGYYTFNVFAIDLVEHTDTATVNIYVISESNQVKFKFNNTLEEVNDNRNNIIKVLKNEFKYDCGIDQLYQSADDERLKQTSVITHFIDNDSIPIDNKIIYAKVTDPNEYIQLTNAFLDYGLIYSELNINFPDNINNMEKLMAIILSVVAFILGILCIILFIAFIIKTKSLNRQLKALSETKFGSQASNLNRMGAPMPNTNQFAIDGSNPVWNEKIKPIDFDNHSIISGDSDLVGIENSPVFNSDSISVLENPEEERRASFNPVMKEQIQEIKRRSLNPMAHLDINDDNISKQD